MTIGHFLGALIVCGAAVGGAAAQDRLPTKPTPPELPAIPKASDPDAVIVPVVAKVVAAEAPMNGAEQFPKTLADAKAAHAKARDYVGHFVRQERVNGTLQPEQSGEIRVRAEPFSVAVKVLAPKAAAGWETVYVAGKRDDKVRFKAAGIAGLNGFTTVAMDSAKAMAGTRHPIKDVGMLAVLARAEKVVEAEKKLKNPVQITVSDYTFNSRPCQRFEIFADRPHPTRYCHRVVLYVDTATKLPVRFEAYDQPKTGEVTGELIEMVSFVNLKLNTGLGDSTFDK
jgi:Protein of unknown function (DUF1571)